MTGVGVHPIRIDRAPTRVAPNGWSPARADLSGDVLREIHLAVLVVDDHDRIVYANEMAVASLGDDLVNSPFAHLWRDDPEDVHHALVSVASAPDWRAFNLHPRNQSADAPAVLLRGRRLVVNRPPVTPSPQPSATPLPLGKGTGVRRCEATPSDQEEIWPARPAW